MSEGAEARNHERINCSSWGRPLYDDTKRPTIPAVREWAERFHRSTGVYPDWEQIDRLFLARFSVDV